MRLKSAWPRMNTAATAIEISPKSTSRSELKAARSAADNSECVRRIVRNAQFKQRPGEQRGNDRRGLAVGVGQPGVQRRQSHLGSVTDQEEEERRLEPERIQAAGVGNQIVDRQMDHRPAGRPRGHGDEEIAQQRQGDAHRTDQQVFPGRFQRAVMAMKVDQRGAGQGGGFDAHPHQAQVAADGHQRHGRQEQQQASGEDGLGEVHERQFLLVVVSAFPAALSLGEIADGVNGGRQEEHAGDAEEQQRQRRRWPSSR